MAVTITHPAEDISASSEGKITTIERLMIVNGSNMTEIATSLLVPQPESRHPKNSNFVLTNRSFEQVGNVGREVQAQVTLTYSNNGNVGDGDKDPWDLDAQNVQVGYTTEPTPLLNGFDKQGNKFQLLNSAGSRLLIEGQNIIRQISFTFCVKDGKSGEAPLNNRAIINSKSERAAGYKFDPFTAMLMPMNATFIQDVDEYGEIYRRYWQIEAVIMENSKTWERQALDVGTMALFEGMEYPQPIYQYTPWRYPDPGANIGIQPLFGSIDDVIRAKTSYADMVSPGNATEWAKNYDLVPYNEITEPLPLINGKVYTNAIKDPLTYPYGYIPYFETKPGSWNKYNLPKKRA